MAQNVAVVNATLTATGSGTTDFTVSGFGTPSAAIVIVGDAASGFNPQASAGVSIGVWDGTNQCVHSIRSFDALATTSTFRLSRNDYAAAFVGSSTTWSAGYSASSITDGIRLTMGVDNTGAQRFATVILLSGVSAKISRLTLSSSTNGTATTGSIGFAPTAAIVLGSGLAGNTAASGSTQSANALLSFGAATSDGAHRMIAWASSDSTATATVTSLYSETRLASQVSAGTESWSAEVTTWGADSLTMTSRTGGSGGDDVDILCLGGADLSLLLGTLTTATSTGSADVTTTGIDPDAVLLCLGNTSSTTIASDGTASGFAVGASDGTTHGGYALVDEDAADTTNTESSYSSANAVYSRTSASGTASDLVVGSVSMGAEKFSVNYTTVSGTARKGWFLAFGPAAAGGGASVGLATETDTAHPLSALQIAATGIATESDSAQALAALSLAAVGVAAESDAALALAALQVQAVGRADESDAALALSAGSAAPVGTAAETDAALALSALQIATAGTALETDIALALVPNAPGSVGVALEADTALALAAVQSRPVGMATDTGLALALAAVQAITAGMALEIDGAQALAAMQASAVGRANETDTALALAAGGSGTGTGATAAEIWSYVLSNGKTAEQTVVEAHAMLTALLSGITSLPADVRAELESTAIPVNVKKMNGADVIGTGAENDPWRGVGVQP